MDTMVQTNRKQINYSNMVVVYRNSTKGYDPTRTTALRDAFANDMQRRFNQLKLAIRQAVVDQDCFGLKPTTNARATQGSPELGLPGNRAFQFSTKEQKVNAFMDWLREQEAKGILQTASFSQLGQAAREPWTNMYIADSYKRGVIRARYEMGRVGMAVPGMDMTGGIAASMSTPFHMDRVGMMYTRTFEDLKGITASMDSQISRILSQGMIDGDGPAVLAKKLTDTIGGKLGIKNESGKVTMSPERRAKILARTEVIRAHHSATIQEYRNWGVAGVDVEAEFRTAGDSRVCSQCSSLEGKIYTLDEAEGIIPVHPGCRCITIPTMPDDKPEKVVEVAGSEDLENSITPLKDIPKEVTGILYYTDGNSLEIDVFDKKIVNAYKKRIRKGEYFIPSFIGKDNLQRLYDGNHRAAAYKALNLPVPVVVVDGADMFNMMGTGMMSAKDYFIDIGGQLAKLYIKK